MQEPLSISINPAGCVNQFIRAMDSHVGNLRNILRSIEDGAFRANVNAQPPGSLVHFQINDATTPEDSAARRATAGCFKGILADFIAFLDRMIATKKVVKTRRFIIDRPLNGEAEILEYLQGLVEQTYVAVAKDQSLTNPKKLEELQVSTEASRLATAYFALRRCLEHRGGVPESNISIWTKRIILSVESDEITRLPHPVQAGQSLNVRIGEDQKTFAAGSEVVLTEQDIEGVALALRMIANEIILSVASPTNP